MSLRYEFLLGIECIWMLVNYYLFHMQIKWISCDQSKLYLIELELIE